MSAPATEERAPALLEIRDLSVRFGGVHALEGISFDVHEGQICALIGPNGAGKTTAFNTISRFVKPDSGSIRFAGHDLLRRRPSEVSSLGIMRTFQNLALSPGMTVIENVMVGAHLHGLVGFAGAPFAIRTRREDRELRARAYGMLESFGIAEFADRPCHGLPYGTMKRIELARAMAAQPRLLMLDEPAGGLTQAGVRELADLLRHLRDVRGLTLLLVEHHMQLVMDVSDYVVALDFGCNLVQGRPDEVRNDPKLIEAYLGTAA